MIRSPLASSRAIAGLALTVLVGLRGIATAAQLPGEELQPASVSGRVQPADRPLRLAEVANAARERAWAIYRSALRAGARGFHAYLAANPERSCDRARRVAMARLARDWESIPLPVGFTEAYQGDLARRLDVGGEVHARVQATLAARADLGERAARLARIWSLHFALRELATDELVRAADGSSAARAASPRSPLGARRAAAEHVRDRRRHGRAVESGL